MSKYEKNWDVDGVRSKLYGRRWRKSRALFLGANPLCAPCAALDRMVIAEVVDHIKPHRGDYELFWDVNNWQPLCQPCHDRDKQEIERRGYSTRVGSDGWPLDPSHPSNKRS